MNLFEQKNKNIKKTWLLFSIFLIFVIGLGLFFSRIYGNSNILVFAVIFSSLMSILSYWFSDKIVLAMAGAKAVDKKSAPELYKIVGKLAEKADLPLPKIYVVNSPAPNAFATGRNPKHAVVAVTTGLLSRLSSEELEGVLAHELSHIGNRDMLISTAVVILVGFISLLSDMFLRSMIWGGFRGRDRESGQLGTVMFLVGIILSILAPISAMLIQLAISRRREFLADASGAFLTKNPHALASALEKIASDPTPLLRARNTTAHLWFDDPFTHGLGRKKTPVLHKLFMTHPPVEERIDVLRNLKI